METLLLHRTLIRREDSVQCSAISFQHFHEMTKLGEMKTTEEKKLEILRTRSDDVKIKIL